MVNLVANAIDAAADGGRRVTVRVLEHEAEVVIEVDDDGPGVDPSIATRIQPFATTKPSGRGTGLGLAITHQIVHYHRGTNALGTCAATCARLAIPGFSPSSHRVLVVDGDRAVLRALAADLRRAGFVVDAAVLLGEAEQMLAEHRARVIVAETTLPDGSGPQVLARLRVASPTSRRAALVDYAGRVPGADIAIQKPWDAAARRRGARAVRRRRADAPAREVSRASSTADRQPGQQNNDAMAEGDGTFGLAAPYAVETNPHWIAFGDLSGDGKIDMAVINYGSSSFSVLVGNGDGTFQMARTTTTGPVPVSIVARDFNGDGKLDLVIPIYGANSVSVLLGNGDATFQAAQSFGTRLVWAASAADFNGDGDLAIAHFGFYAQLPDHLDLPRQRQWHLPGRGHRRPGHPAHRGGHRRLQRGHQAQSGRGELLGALPCRRARAARARSRPRQGVRHGLLDRGEPGEGP